MAIRQPKVASRSEVARAVSDPMETKMTAGRNSSLRNGSVELLRCILMFNIVLWHCWRHGPFWGHSIVLAVLFSLLLWHVDCFIAISGWFGMKFRIEKFLRIYGLIVFYSLIGSFIAVFVHHKDWSVKDFVVWGTWFPQSYLGLMLIAPLINRLVDSLSKESVKERILAWAGVAAVMLSSWIPNVFGFRPSGVGSTTLALLVSVYFTARLLRLSIQVPISKRILQFFIGGGCFFSVLISFLLAIGLRSHAKVETCIWAFNQYVAPHTALMAVSVLLLFVWHIRVPDSIANVCRFIGPSMLGVLLAHCCIPGVQGWALATAQNWVVAKDSSFKMGLVVVLGAALTFVVSLLVDLVRRLVLRCLMMMGALIFKRSKL